MIEVCVNCGTETNAMYYCPECQLYVQVEEKEEEQDWKITLTVCKYVPHCSRQDAEYAMADLVDSITRMDRKITIEDEMVEED